MKPPAPVTSTGRPAQALVASLALDTGEAIYSDAAARVRSLVRACPCLRGHGDRRRGAGEGRTRGWARGDGRDDGHPRPAFSGAGEGARGARGRGGRALPECVAAAGGDERT